MSLHYAGSYHKMVIDILKTLAYYFLSVISPGNRLKSLMSSLFADVGHRLLCRSSAAFRKIARTHCPFELS